MGFPVGMSLDKAGVAIMYSQRPCSMYVTFSHAVALVMVHINFTKQFFKQPLNRRTRVESSQQTNICNTYIIKECPENVQRTTKQSEKDYPNRRPKWQ